MVELIRSSSDEPPPVWPYAQGELRGQAIQPLHRAAPGWSELGEMLSLLDSLRAGDGRVVFAGARRSIAGSPIRVHRRSRD